MEPETRRNWPLLLALLTVAVVFCGYVIGWPLASLLAEPMVTARGVRLNSTPLLDQVQMRLFEAVIAFWFFLFGASLGSFLNVVVFRTPRGLSLLGSSFCPKCGRHIRWHDNLPVFGWLHLRGRCRDCGLPIAARYPLVELLAGMMVLSVAVAGLFLDGANLPGASRGVRFGISWLMVRPRADLVAGFVYHTALLCILLSWCLIRWDGFRLPRGYVLLALLFGFALPLAVPQVHPVAWVSPPPDWLAACAWCPRLATSVVGGLAGALLGIVQGGTSHLWAGVSAQRNRSTVDLAAAYSLVGVCLGWQALVSVFVLAASTRIVFSTLTGGVLLRPSAAAWVYLTLAVFLQSLAWDALDAVAGWPGTDLTPAAAAVPLAVSFYFVLVASYVEQRRIAE